LPSTPPPTSTKSATCTTSAKSSTPATSFSRKPKPQLQAPNTSPPSPRNSTTSCPKFPQRKLSPSA
jgi:hypothetical protein